MEVQVIRQKFVGSPEKLFGTAAMSDHEIIRQSYAKGEEVSKNSFSGKLLHALPSITIGGVILASGILTEGGLSTKLKSVFKSMGACAIVCAACGLVYGAMAKLENRNKTLKQVNERYRGMSTVAKIGAAYGVSSLAIKGVGKITENLGKAFPNIAESHRKTSKLVAESIDGSIFGKITNNITESFQNFKTKHPKLPKLKGRHMFLASILGFMGLSTLLAVHNEKKKQNAMRSKAQELINERFQAQDMLLGLTELNTTSV